MDNSTSNFNNRNNSNAAGSNIPKHNLNASQIPQSSSNKNTINTQSSILQKIEQKDPTTLENIFNVDNLIKNKNKFINSTSEKGSILKDQKYSTIKKFDLASKNQNKSLFDKIYDFLFGIKSIQNNTNDKQNVLNNNTNNISPNNIDNLNQQNRMFTTTQDLLEDELVSVQDKIAPISLEVDFNDIKINDTYVRTICIIDYKKAFPGIFESLINYEEPIDISMYYYPIDTAEIIERIRKKIVDIEAQLNLELERGKVPNAYLKVALQDALLQQEELASGAEKYFHFAVYITIKSDKLSDLNNLCSKIFSDLRSKEMNYKVPTLRMEQAFKSSLPYGLDYLKISRNMDTTSIAMTFPFTSSDLSQDRGVLYGINTYNKGLIIFDRFSMPNANMVVFATSGGGKSYFVKLEILRSMMLGTECIVIDPENEYEELAKTVGGSYISFSQDGKNKLNPFELPFGSESSEDELRLKELSLQGFFKILFGGLSTKEVTVLDRAIRMAYREKGITNDKSTFVNEPPRMEDLYKTLRSMEEFEAQEMAMKLERFLVGSAAGIFDKKTNIDINNQLTVFSIRELSEELRPLAMYLMLDFIWTKVKKERKRRILAIDEAWLLMKYPDSALFVNSVAKRARKYYLGLTTITQDVADFLSTDYGKAIITNSSIQVLFRQNQVSVDALSMIYNLSEGEKIYLQNVPPGQGLFFAGGTHVSILVKASPEEHVLVTSNPIEIEKMKKKNEEKV